jgi:hypothetical protein
MSDSRLVSQIDKSSCSNGCQNKIGFVRTSSCNYYDVSEIEGYSLNCHQWGCPACAKVLKNQLLDRINLGLQDKSDFYFYTLTSSYHDMQIKAAFNRFRNVLNLKNNYPIDKYVQVMELTPPSHVYEDWRGIKKVSVGGLRHFHGLMSFVDKIPCKAEFGAYWERATKGKAWHTHFEKLWDLKSPAGYMSNIS